MIHLSLIWEKNLQFKQLCVDFHINCTFSLRLTGYQWKVYPASCSISWHRLSLALFFFLFFFFLSNNHVKSYFLYPSKIRQQFAGFGPAKSTAKLLFIVSAAMTKKIYCSFLSKMDILGLYRLKPTQIHYCKQPLFLKCKCVCVRACKCGKADGRG